MSSNPEIKLHSLKPHEGGKILVISTTDEKSAVAVYMSDHISQAGMLERMTHAFALLNKGIADDAKALADVHG